MKDDRPHLSLILRAIESLEWLLKREHLGQSTRHDAETLLNTLRNDLKSLHRGTGTENQ